MPTYLYETLSPTGTPRRFEFRQRFDEPALAEDPVTGEPVRRVIVGGLGIVTKSEGAGTSPPQAGCGPDTCSCGKFS